MKLLESSVRNLGDRFGTDLAFWQISAQLLAARLQVFPLRAVVRRAIERSIVQFFIGNGDSKARAKGAQLIFIQLLLLMSDVLAFARLAQAIALDGFRENDGWCAFVLYRGFICRMYFDRIVPSQPHTGQLLVRKMFDHFQETWICAAKVLPEVSSALNKIFLILPVCDLAHPPDKQSVAIVLDEHVPIPTPDHLDYIPARSAENCLQLLNNLSIPADRSIQPLQIAVHDEDEIVQPL